MKSLPALVLAGMVSLAGLNSAAGADDPNAPPAADQISYFKQIAPIWKKERFEGGEVWVGSLADCEHDHAHEEREGSSIGQDVTRERSE